MSKFQTECMVFCNIKTKIKKNTRNKYFQNVQYDNIFDG